MTANDLVGSTFIATVVNEGRYVVAWPGKENPISNGQKLANINGGIHAEQFATLSWGYEINSDIPCEIVKAAIPKPPKKEDRPMQIKDAKVGDKIKVPITDLNYFTFAESFLVKGSYIKATVLEQGPNGTIVIGWNETDRVVSDMTKKPMSSRPELHKKHPKLSFVVDINPDVPCEKIVGTIKRSKKPASFGLLLGGIAAGAGISRLSTRQSGKALVSLAKKAAR
jgi:hypothetical protein